MPPIPDHLQEGLSVLFVGFNPSLLSGETGHHFANPRNRFWNILNRAGFTPYKFSPEEDVKLIELGYGLTNIVPRPTKAADEITREEYNEGKEALKGKIAYYKPQYVCFVGKGVYEQYSGTRKVSWGFQQKQIVTGVIDFVAPSSSGLVRMKLDEIVKIYEKLSAEVIDKK